MRLHPPPDCPHCGESLDSVYETTYDTYTFNPATGHYEDDGYLTITCPYCNGKLGDVPGFEDGMCNYIPPQEVAPCPSTPTTP